jgi:hypothetical protein
LAINTTYFIILCCALESSGMSKTFTEKNIPNLKEHIATKMYNPLYVPLVQAMRET